MPTDKVSVFWEGLLRGVARLQADVTTLRDSGVLDDELAGVAEAVANLDDVCNTVASQIQGLRELPTRSENLAFELQQILAQGINSAWVVIREMNSVTKGDLRASAALYKREIARFSAQVLDTARNLATVVLLDQHHNKDLASFVLGDAPAWHKYVTMSEKGTEAVQELGSESSESPSTTNTALPEGVAQAVLEAKQCLQKQLETNKEIRRLATGLLELRTLLRTTEGQVATCAQELTEAKATAQRLATAMATADKMQELVVKLEDKLAKAKKAGLKDEDEEVQALQKRISTIRDQHHLSSDDALGARAREEQVAIAGMFVREKTQQHTELCEHQTILAQRIDDQQAELEQLRIAAAEVTQKASLVLAEAAGATALDEAAVARLKTLSESLAQEQAWEQVETVASSSLASPSFSSPSPSPSSSSSSSSSFADNDGKSSENAQKDEDESERMIRTSNSLMDLTLGDAQTSHTIDMLNSFVFVDWDDEDGSATG